MRVKCGLNDDIEEMVRKFVYRYESCNCRNKWTKDEQKMGERQKQTMI
jgi:hypothetical protein